MTDPCITIVDEFGHVRVDWPDPRRDFYPVSHEVIQGWVDTLNRLGDLREYLMMKSYRHEIIAIIDPEAV